MKTSVPDQKFFRWSVYIIGLIIMSLGISLTILADLGSAPWDVLHIGLTNQFGLTIGTWTIIMGFITLITATMLTKEWPKAGAYLNMILVGVFVDIHLFILTTPSTLIGQGFMLVAGILIMGFGIGLYISPRCGAGPRDSFMLAVSEKTGMTASRIRGLMEIVVLAFGWYLGGPVFFGTIIFSLTIGPVTGHCLVLCQTWMDRRMERGISVENIH
ncbi:YitT family protein [Bacillus sp. H-16]|uniref:YczE/YyaS/YitT family protein n=1 Tax=Alteribacter salitolerans TaxID=2912333 RepID=UPI001965B274|nr:YitT family protein [Alteribacter salitolerans]MBM7097201.1 YitT family protein [Alteribacter salitolerans]